MMTKNVALKRLKEILLKSTKNKFSAKIASEQLLPNKYLIIGINEVGEIVNLIDEIYGYAQDTEDEIRW